MFDIIGDVAVDDGDVPIATNADLMTLASSEGEGPVAGRVRRCATCLVLEAEPGRLGLQLAVVMLPIEE